MLRIAVQAKGRLHEETMTMLSESSIKIESGKRTLLVPSKNFPVEILYLRDDDIPQAVASGIADVGVVGENEYEEKAENAEIVQRLGFSKCRLSLAIPKEADYNGVEWFEGKKIATSYPVILEKFLKSKNVNAEIHEISGSVEIAPGIGLADCIFDIVSSGGTLISNNLKEVEIVMYSEALLIADKNLSKEKQEILDSLLFRIDAYKTAQGQKYIMLNIPTAKIDDLQELVPGLTSPTVMPLVKEGWSALQSVVDEYKVWDIIEKLKLLGAQDIIVVPIEKMVR
ncbi:MAG: ATP phosphoribosyltransferase [Prevotellaceae bacterium]|jgi:ATP phosphoribosyltransferase|nr:ATP phosphoribosyltransferase [Prevotellaceae bacterium]